MRDAFDDLGKKPQDHWKKPSAAIVMSGDVQLFFVAHSESRLSGILDMIDEFEMEARYPSVILLSDGIETPEHAVFLDYNQRDFVLVGSKDDIIKELGARFSIDEPDQDKLDLLHSSKSNTLTRDYLEISEVCNKLSHSYGCKFHAATPEDLEIMDAVYSIAEPEAKPAPEEELFLIEAYF